MTLLGETTMLGCCPAGHPKTLVSATSWTIQHLGERWRKANSPSRLF